MPGRDLVKQSPRATLSRIGLRHGCALGALAFASVMLPQAAQAQSCGAPVNGTVTCTAAGNPYPTGIQYAPVQDLTIVLQPDVVVAPNGTTSAVVLQGPVRGAVIAQTGATINTGGSGIFVNSVETSVDNGATISAGTRGIGAYADNEVTVSNTGSITVNGARNGANFASGIAAGSDFGPIAVTNSGDVNVAGTGTDFFLNGIIAQTYQSGATIDIDNSGDIALTTTGTDGFANAIFAGAYANGAGSTAIVNSGDLTVTAANTARGIASFNYNDGGVVIQNTGDIAVTGANAHGIIVESRGSTLPSDVAISSTGDIVANSTVGGFAAGVRASTFGDLAIDVANVTATGNATQGIIGRADGDITVAAGTVSTTGSNSNAVDLNSYSGAIDLAVGDVSTTGALSGGVRAIGGTDGDVSVTTGNVTTTGTAGSNYAFLPNSSAIVATASGTGNVMVSAGDIATAGQGAVGVNANAADGNVSVATGDIATTGSRANGVSAQSYTGNVAVSTGTVSTVGDTSAGVYAVARNGGVAVDAGDVTTTGFNSRGINAIGGAGGVTVGFDSVDVSGTFSSGISAISNGGPVVVSGADVTASGTSNYAIYAASDVGNVNVTTTGDVVSSGRGGTGIFASSDTGDTTVIANNVSVVAADPADAATTRGAIFASGANTTVVVTGLAETGGSAIYGGSADAITAISTAGDTSVSVMDVTTAGDNADAVNATSNTGMTRVAVRGDVATSGTGSVGIRATSATGTSVTNAGTIATTGNYADAIRATAPQGGNVAITNTGSISTAGNGSNGIYASGDAVTITGNGTIVTSGGFNNGIRAVGYNDVTISTGAVATTGAGARGIGGYSRYGNVSITTTGTTSTQGFGASGILGSAGQGDVTITTAGVTTVGDSSTAVFASAGDRATVVATGPISTRGAGSVGITAFGTDVAVTNNGALTTAGDRATGINVSGQTVRVSSAGPITTAGNLADGVRAGGGNLAIQVGNVTTSGAGSRGVFAQGYTAAVVVTGTVRTSGGAAAGYYGSTNADGVVVRGTNGDASATVNNVTTSGAGSRAVVVTATGDATATVNGAVRTTGTGADAVFVNGGDNATVNLGTGGSVLATSGNSITLTSVNGSTLNNAGTIANNTGGIAVLALGGPVTINNSGSLTSDIVLTGGADRVNNSGTFVVGVNPDFGAGNDSFVNTGTVLVGSGATAVVAPTFTGLESFTNAGGLVELRNNRGGDTLTLPGTFTGTGDSRLGLDVAFGAASDRLIIGGAASGSTTILINSLNGNLFSFGNGGTLVDVGAASNANAFTLAGGSQQQGLVRLELVYDAANTRYDLIGAPSDAAFETLNYLEGVRSLWLASADVVTAQLRARRDALWANGGGDPSARTWMQIYGSVETRENSRDVSAFSRTRTLATGYEQDYFGGQVGIDVGGASGEKGGFAFGVTGGYLNSSQNFAGSSDRIGYDVVNAGVYASYSSGNLFFNALGKYDHFWGNLNGQAAGFSRDVDGNIYGARAEAGLRFGSETFFVEPAASISYTKTDFDDFAVNATTVSFDDDDGLRGRAGARIGGQFGVAGASTGSFYAGANYVHEFSGRDGVTFSNNGQSFTYLNDRIRDYGEALVGLSIGSPNGISGFFEGTYRRSFNSDNGNTDLEGAGGRAGLRIRF